MARAEGTPTHKVEVNGDPVSMGGEMGPIIINLDGTVRRISNWRALTTREKQVAWRKISERNRARLSHLGLDHDAVHELPEQVAEESGNGNMYRLRDREEPEDDSVPEDSVPEDDTVLEDDTVPEVDTVPDLGL